MQDFTQRRRYIRQQRQLQLLRKLWQFLAVTAVTALCLWVSLRQEWHLRSSQQIEVIGNRYIPTSDLQAIVPISYPQSIFQLDPQAIATHLETVAPLEQVWCPAVCYPLSSLLRCRSAFLWRCPAGVGGWAI